MNVLTVSGLRKRFISHLRPGPARWVLDEVDVNVPRGSCVVVTGPSGSGKSSLLRCVYRTYLPDAGTVRVACNGATVDLASASDRRVLAARRDIVGMATQFLAVTPRVSARDLVAAEGVGGDEAGEWLRRLGLAEELVDATPAGFSGGERQMLNLAIAMARPRPLLLLDEVTASLDPARRRLAIAALAERKRQGTSMLAVFHDVPSRTGLVDQVVQMSEGKVVA